jgi:CheY-like chemotaxis protein/two-component sensor histidine kinase
LLALINDILDLSRIEAGRMETHLETVQVGPMLQALVDAFQPIAKEKNLRLILESDSDVPSTIRTDGIRLQQILRNLLSNALKFTPFGSVTLEVSRVATETISFSVTDTGIGIAPEHLETVFEAFRQADQGINRKYGGTGLGLAISRELANLLGGMLKVTSEFGKGSTFTLVLPLESGTWSGSVAALASPKRLELGLAAATSAPKDDVDTSGVDDDRSALEIGERCILIIEDDPNFAAILREVVKERGFPAAIALRGAEGLELAMKLAPSAILLDVQLPDRSGLSVLESLKEHPRTRHIPVHVVSVADHSREALQLGAIGYCLKPAPRDRLLEVIDRISRSLTERVKHILVFYELEEHRTAFDDLLSAEGLELTWTESADEAVTLLEARAPDCVVLDVSHLETEGVDLLERLARRPAFSLPPVVVYSARRLHETEEERIATYSKSLLVKDAPSLERLLDEVTLFLHQLEARLAPNQRRMLQRVRHREKQLEGKTVLVVDDDPRNLFALSSALEPKGLKVMVARNGREALERVDHAAAENPFGIDLVLMDIMMPVMDGLTAMREIRSRACGKKLPIIALTAKAMPDDKEKCLDAGASDYIPKPLDVPRLVALMKVWLARRS